MIQREVDGILQENKIKKLSAKSDYQDHDKIKSEISEESVW